MRTILLPLLVGSALWAACGSTNEPNTGESADTGVPVSSGATADTPPSTPPSAQSSAAPSVPPPLPTPVAVTMPSPDEAKAALALKCSSKKSGSGCTDKAGKVVIPFEYQGTISFKPSGLALVQHSTRGWAFINGSNVTVVEPFMFDNGPDPLKDGLARVQKDGKIGFVDAEWRLVIAPQFDAAFGFEGGAARVCVGCDPKVWSKEGPPTVTKGRELRIDRQGKEL